MVQLVNHFVLALQLISKNHIDILLSPRVSQVATKIESKW